MRTHAQIVSDVGVARLAEMRNVSVNTAASWRHRNSIPAEHWHPLAEAEMATLEELAAHAAQAAAA